MVFSIRYFSFVLSVLLLPAFAVKLRILIPILRWR